MTLTNLQSTIVESIRSRATISQDIWDKCVDLLEHAQTHDDPSVFNPIVEALIEAGNEEEVGRFNQWLFRSAPFAIRLDDNGAFKSYCYKKMSKQDRQTSWDFEYAMVNSPWKKPAPQEKEEKVRDLMDLAKTVRNFRNKPMTKGADAVSAEILNDLNERIDAITQQL